MRSLILSGDWLNHKGLLKAELVDAFRTDSIKGLTLPSTLAFLIFSYDLTPETTDIAVKKASYPTIWCCPISSIEPMTPGRKSYKIAYRGASLSDEDYMKRVNIIKGHIGDGTIYQANLTNRFDFHIEGDLQSLVFDFFDRQPVPYAFLFRYDDFFLFSGSMELFLSKRGQLIQSKPIKGTATDRETLLKSKKDRAENLMITDMMRNDLGRVAKLGSVKTTELFAVTPYRTLYQMHSTVEALTDADLKTIITNTFPPASVTGAPKIKAVEVIDGLEPHARGYYCGVAGLLQTNGDFTLSVLIRTAFGKGNSLSYYAGCGIVWDSSPERELKEMYLKVKAFYQF